MKPPILITVLLKPSARKEGTSVIIPHIAKGMPEREDHTNERKVVDRVVGLGWSLPVPFQSARIRARWRTYLRRPVQEPSDERNGRLR